jgi:Leucine-rich repeat (LRR) protein
MTYSTTQSQLSCFLVRLVATGAVLFCAAISSPIKAQEKAKIDEKTAKNPDAKGDKKGDDKTPAIATTGAAAKPQVKAEKTAEAKSVSTTSVPQPNPKNPAKLKEQITALQKEVTALKLRIATLELEKLGAMVTVDKAKDGTEIATVNILKKWSGDKDALMLLKNVPNLQVVYIDNVQVNDVAIAPLKDLASLSALTLMSPQFTDAGLDHLKGLTNLTMLFLTSSKVSDKGLSSLKGLKNLQVLALSRTDVTDVGLDSLKDLTNLKSIYLIGTKVTPQAVDKLKKVLPGVSVYK